MTKLISFEEFEQAVMQKLLEKNTVLNNKLRKQYKNAQVVRREFTEAGFFTDFKVQENINSVTEPVPHGYGDLLCDINDITGFGGFVLFIKNGIIATLEEYTFQDTWPAVITSYKLYHANNSTRKSK